MGEKQTLCFAGAAFRPSFFSILDFQFGVSNFFSPLFPFSLLSAPLEPSAAMRLASKALRALTKPYPQKINRCLSFFTSWIAQLFLRQSVLPVYAFCGRLLQHFIVASPEDYQPAASFTPQRHPNVQRRNCE